MPMFPDSGVPASEAKNSIDVTTVTPCDELWYSTSRCQPRFDPAAANAMLAEDMNLIMRGEVVYDCKNLDHIERAVRYINQRGLPRACLMLGGPNAYTGVLDPPCTRYNDFMTLTIVPTTTCMPQVTLDIGHGPAYILRNDGQHLDRGDLLVGKPAIIAFYAGYWYVCGLCASQVPILVKGGIDCWIRTDGNDVTGDGTANDPAKAFKSIAGCFAAVGSRYAATPLFSINMRFGIPGTYQGTAIGPFGGRVTLTGDVNNPAAYRVTSGPWGPDGYICFWAQGINSMQLNGVTLEMSRAGPQASTGLLVAASNCGINNCIIECIAPNPRGIMVLVGGSGAFSTIEPTTTFQLLGNNHKINAVFSAGNGNCEGAFLNPGQTSNYYWTNLNADVMLACGSLSTMHWGSATNFIINNCVGAQYSVSENSIINMGGKPVPGTPGTGVMSSGGRFIP